MPNSTFPTRKAAVQGVNIVCRLLVAVGLPHGTKYGGQVRLGYHDFQPPLGYLFPTTLLPNNGVCGLGAEESPGPSQTETALRVLPDVAGPGSKHGVGNLRQVRVGNKHDEVVLP